MNLIPPGVSAALQAAKRAEPQIRKLKDASKQIEGMFVKDLLTQMEKGLGKSLFGSAPGAAIYQDMFTQAIADSVAQSGSFGVAKTLEKQFTKDVYKLELQKVQREMKDAQAEAEFKAKALTGPIGPPLDARNPKLDSLTKNQS